MVRNKFFLANENSGASFNLSRVVSHKFIKMLIFFLKLTWKNLSNVDFFYMTHQTLFQITWSTEHEWKKWRKDRLFFVNYVDVIVVAFDTESHKKRLGNFLKADVNKLILTLKNSVNYLGKVEEFKKRKIIFSCGSTWRLFQKILLYSNIFSTWKESENINESCAIAITLTSTRHSDMLHEQPTQKLKYCRHTCLLLLNFSSVPNSLSIFYNSSRSNSVK